MQSAAEKTLEALGVRFYVFNDDPTQERVEGIVEPYINGFQTRDQPMKRKELADLFLVAAPPSARRDQIHARILKQVIA